MIDFLFPAPNSWFLGLYVLGKSFLGSQRDAPIAAVFEEYTAIYLPLIDTRFLITGVHYIVSASRLLQDADLVLSLAGVVVRQGLRYRLEWCITHRVINLKRARERDRRMY